jgi:hypothetical protein
MPAMIDLRGQTLGRLTVMADSGEREGSNIIWLCDCSCGTTGYKTTGKRLRSGKTRSCGCLRREVARARRTIDVMGVEFGFSRFVRDTGERRGGNHADNGCVVWECECFGGSRYGFPGCKGTFVATRGDVYDNGQVSCGCYRNHLGRSRAINVTGQTFGYLTAIQPTEERSGNDVVWLCVCNSPLHDEPREHRASLGSLRGGHTRSCGCLFTEQASRRAIEKMKSRHRKNWPYVREDGSAVWMRAATEVAWATWLDRTGKAWKYEPNAFLLSNGRRYVPDFFLPEESCWHEVKGRETADTMAKYEEFARDHRCQIITVPVIEQALGMRYRDLLILAKRVRDEYNASKHTVV